MGSVSLFWLLLGALIGISAAQRRGFNVAAGALGGALLGPLAFLLYFVSGITRADVGRKKCPYCAEWVKGEAVVCRHCGRDLQSITPPPATGTRTLPRKPSP